VADGSSAAQQTQSPGGQKSQAPEGPALTSSSDNQSSSSPIASSWDECVDLVFPANGSRWSCGGKTQARGARGDSQPADSNACLIGVRVEPAERTGDASGSGRGSLNGSGKWSLADSGGPGYCSVRPADPKEGRKTESGGQAGHSERTASEAQKTPTEPCLCSGEAKESPEALPKESPVAEGETCSSQGRIKELEGGQREELASQEQRDQGQLARPKSGLSGASAELIRAQKSLATAAAAKVHKDRMARMLKFHSDSYQAASGGPTPNALACKPAHSEPVAQVLTVRTGAEPDFWFEGAPEGASRATLPGGKAETGGGGGLSSSAAEQRRGLLGSKLAAGGLLAGQQQQQQRAAGLGKLEEFAPHRSGNNSVCMSDSSPSNNGADSDNSASLVAARLAAGRQQEERPPLLAKRAKLPVKSEPKGGPLGGILSRILLHNGGDKKAKAVQKTASQQVQVAAPAGDHQLAHQMPTSKGGSIGSSASPTISSSSPSDSSNNRSPQLASGQQATSGETLGEVGACGHQQHDDKLAVSRSRRPIVLAGSNEMERTSSSSSSAPFQQQQQQRLGLSGQGGHTQLLAAHVFTNGLPRVASYSASTSSSSGNPAEPSLQVMPSEQFGAGPQTASLCNYHALNRSQLIPAKYSHYLPYNLGRYSMHEQCELAGQQQAASQAAGQRAGASLLGLQQAAPLHYMQYPMHQQTGAHFHQQPTFETYGGRGGLQQSLGGHPQQSLGGHYAQTAQFVATNDESIYIPPSYVANPHEQQTSNAGLHNSGLSYRAQNAGQQHFRLGVQPTGYNGEHELAQQLRSASRVRESSSAAVGRPQEVLRRPKSSLDSLLLANGISAGEQLGSSGDKGECDYAPARQRDTMGRDYQRERNNGHQERFSSANETKSRANSASQMATSNAKRDTLSGDSEEQRLSLNQAFPATASTSSSTNTGGQLLRRLEFSLEQNSIYAPGSNGPPDSQQEAQSSSSLQQQQQQQQSHYHNGNNGSAANGRPLDTSGSSNNSGASQLTVLPAVATNATDEHHEGHHQAAALHHWPSGRLGKPNDRLNPSGDNDNGQRVGLVGYNNNNHNNNKDNNCNKENYNQEEVPKMEVRAGKLTRVSIGAKTVAKIEQRNCQYNTHNNGSRSTLLKKPHCFIQQENKVDEQEDEEGGVTIL